MLPALVILAAACGTSAEPPDRPFTLGVLPDEAPERLTQKYSGLSARLEAALDREVELVIPSDYDDLVARFARGEVDLGYFGGLTYLLARGQADAEPLVMRDIDARFTSVFLSRTGDARATLEDFAGAVLGFGSELSTSGHLMPRYYLAEEFGLAPEDHFGEVRYSGTHDRTTEWVLDGTVEIGVVNAQVFRTLVADGTVDREALRVVYETPIYVDYVFAHHRHLPNATVVAIRDALLDLSVVDEADRLLLQDLGAARFIPAFPHSWETLESVSESLGFLHDR